MKKMIVAEIRIPDRDEMKQGKTEVAVMSVIWGIIIFLFGAAFGGMAVELFDAPNYDEDEDEWTWRWMSEDDETVGEPEGDQDADPEEE